jgi:hypothetical protein
VTRGPADGAGGRGVLGAHILPAQAVSQRIGGFRAAQRTQPAAWTLRGEHAPARVTPRP